MEQTASAGTLPNPRLSRSWQLRFLREVLIVGFCYLVYSQVRGLAGGRVFDAFTNAYNVIEIERSLGIFKELAFQALILPHEIAVHIFNLIYFYGLFPLLLPTALFLYFRRPHVYELARNAFLASGAIAVVFYLALPTAPPRLLGIGFIDTLSAGLTPFTPSYGSIPGVNPYAAVPSMHVGWNFLTALALFWGLSGARWRGAIFILPAAMFTATVVTGNHYFIDGVLGIIVACIGLGVALYLRRVLHKRRAAALAQAPTSS